MPEITNAEKNGKLRVIVKLKTGERISICRCFASKEFPICDGSHRGLPFNVGPAVVEAVNPEEEKPT